MSYEYVNRRRTDGAAKKADPAPSRPSVDELRSGAARPTREQLGRRVDLPEAMREKMEASFGADLSGVKLYESDAVKEAGANAITQGSDIAFAPGMLDFTSFGGQSLLGHEISHVVSQARGEVTGSGFLNNASLEARADREGAMAAAGQQVAMPAAPMSGFSAAAAAGPMQADKEDKYRKQQAEYYDKAAMASSPKEREKFMEKYGKAKANKEKRMRKRGVDNYEAINEDTYAITSGTSQLARARARNKDDDAGYFQNAQQILDFMPDEQLMHDREAGFREQLVDEYTAYRKGQNDGGNAFRNGDVSGGYGPVADMYTRMMGKENIGDAVNGEDIGHRTAAITELAKEKKVAPLLARQYQGYYGDEAGGRSEHDFMRNFWNYSVMTLGTGNSGAEYRNAHTTLNDEHFGLNSYSEQNLQDTADEYASVNADVHSVPADVMSGQSSDADASVYAFLNMVSGQKRRR